MDRLITELYGYFHYIESVTKKAQNSFVTINYVIKRQIGAFVLWVYVNVTNFYNFNILNYICKADKEFRCAYILFLNIVQIDIALTAAQL